MAACRLEVMQEFIGLVHSTSEKGVEIEEHLKDNAFANTPQDQIEVVMKISKIAQIEHEFPFIKKPLVGQANSPMTGIK